MGKIQKLNKSRRTHWRSDDKLVQIHRKLPWNRRRVGWGMVLTGFLAAAILTQLFIWASRVWSPAKTEPLALCVASVTDGDTFRLCDGDKVRLVAASGPIDAPEISYRPGRWNDPTLAQQAKARLEQLLDGGALQCDGYDRYERRLCRVIVGGRDVGDHLVAEGLVVIRNDWR